MRFHKDKGARNVIINVKYMIKTPSKRSIQAEQYLCKCFIDYTKAFNKMQHEQRGVSTN